MDPKASAKSKRSHTQRGRKSHPTPSAIAQKKKQQPPQPAAAAAEGEEKPKRAPGRSLPSNWDRYEKDEEEMVSGSLDGTSVEAKLGYGEVAPKSRGADFSYLIEQARSQKPEHRQLDPDRPFPFEDFSFDFMQGTSSMLAAKGKGLASWLEDDNFIIDDPMSTFEVPFLSMDLHAIADHLSTLKLSERLFIEADFFPEELYEESEMRQIHDQAESFKEGRQKDCLGSESSTRQAWSEKNVERDITDKYNSGIGIRVEKHHLLPSRVDVSTKAEVSQCEVAQMHLPESSMHTVQGLEREATSKFKAVDAEAKLDVLLHSLSETNISGSHFHPHSDSMDLPYNSVVNALANAKPSPINHLTKPLKVVGPTSLDDDVDGLLGETSSRIEVKQDTALLPKAGALVFLNADASSRQPTQMPTLDDNLDDLLAETSIQNPASLNKAGRNPSIEGSLFFNGNVLSGKPTQTSTLDDNLDDLLAETSIQNPASLNKAGRNPSIEGSLFFNGNVLSGKPTQTSTLDGTLDDLLEETSVSLGSPESTMGLLQKQGTSSVNCPSKSPLGTGTMDDFDSWFDTIQ